MTDIDTAQLATILGREYSAADSYSEQLYKQQAQAFSYYEAQPFGNETPGRSQVILPDVQESIDYMAASVLRTFVSGDRTVEFEATGEEDEQAARDATAAINYQFMRRQDGYRLLHDGTVDGLLRKIGVFKTVMETEEKVSTETVTAPLDALLLQLPDGVEVLDPIENGDGTITAKVRTTKIEKRFCDYAIPPRRFLFSPNARHEDCADYLCHAEPKTRSELVEMGFDREQVYSLPAYSKIWDQSQNESRDMDSGWRETTSPELEEVLLCEEYARIDLDGDGIAERVKVYRCENEIMIEADTGEPSIEEVGDQPFSVFCPFPRPHKMVGYSLADKVMDLQLSRSFVARQLFDGMAFGNMPRPVVDMKLATTDTLNDLLSPIPGAPIRANGGITAVQPFQAGLDVSKSLQVLEWITGERESRTGITRLNQGLDADALNKTATGTALMQAQGQQSEEFIARNLAETLGRLFTKKYRLMRAQGDPFKVKVDGKYKLIDPSQWPEDINVTVRVGLGSGSKDKRIQYRMSLMQPMAEGMQNGMVTKKQAFHLIDGLVRDMGIGEGDDYWIDPDSPDAPQDQQAQQPDPAMLKLQAEQQQAQAQLELDREKATAQIETDRMKSQAQVEAMREKHALEMQMAREQADQEAQLARERMMIEAQLKQEQMRMQARADVTMGSYREGGALDA